MKIAKYLPAAAAALLCLLLCACGSSVPHGPNADDGADATKPAFVTADPAEQPDESEAPISTEEPGETQPSLEDELVFTDRSMTNSR